MYPKFLHSFSNYVWMMTGFIDNKTAETLRLSDLMIDQFYNLEFLTTLPSLEKTNELFDINSNLVILPVCLLYKVSVLYVSATLHARFLYLRTLSVSS